MRVFFFANRLSEAFQPEDEPHIPCSGTSLRPFGELEACTATIERQCAALSIGKSANTVATPRKDVESLTDKGQFKIQMCKIQCI